uniref:Phosphatidylcholine transfer protein n=1 Tax=Panagrellus redivivus TaxID=6233 RepID=A0A7E4UZD3_PANRE
MYRHVLSIFRNFRNFSRASLASRPINSQRSRRFAGRNIYVPPCLLALSGISLTDYGLTDKELKDDANTIEQQDIKHCATNGWETLVEEQDLRVYRRKLPGSNDIYEYKCSGTYYDITPRNFVDAQCDVEYRRQWDSNVLELDILEDDEESDTQIVRWVARFPYPMYPRVYIYVRRKIVDPKTGKVIISSHALDEKSFPTNSNDVRVTMYRSSMIVHAHKSFDEDGLDYILTYYDNPQTNFPGPAYNWIVNRGGPYFLKQVHAAAKRLEDTALKSTSYKRVPMSVNGESKRVEEDEARGQPLCA